MVEGFWIVQFEGLKDRGGGVAVFTKGHIFGGDNRFPKGTMGLRTVDR